MSYGINRILFFMPKLRAKCVINARLRRQFVPKALLDCEIKFNYLFDRAPYRSYFSDSGHGPTKNLGFYLNTC